VREMGPDAAVREAEGGCSLAGDDAVRGAGYLLSFFGPPAYSRLHFSPVVRATAAGAVAHATRVRACWEPCSHVPDQGGDASGDTGPHMQRR